MRLVALVDPMVERSVAVLAKKRAAAWLESAYRDTVIYKTVAEYAAAVATAPEKKPRYAHPLLMVIKTSNLTLFLTAGRLIVVGCPPYFRGSDQPGKDLEIQLTYLFPGVGLFIEKPITTAAVDSAFRAAKVLKANRVPISVGYVTLNRHVTEWN